MASQARLIDPPGVQEWIPLSEQSRFWLRVYGRPAPQGSKKATVIKNRAVLRESSRFCKPWRSEVAAAARRVVRTCKTGESFPIREDVGVSILFLFPRPKSHFRTGKFSHLLRPDAPLFVKEKNRGDYDKLLRASWDGLAETTGGALIRDDSQIVILPGCNAKRYCYGTELPGAIIEVTPANPWPSCDIDPRRNPVLVPSGTY